jgi:hypothetical protein
VVGVVDEDAVVGAAGHHTPAGAARLGGHAARVARQHRQEGLGVDVVARVVLAAS